jgi:hypothetical protein
MRALAPFAAASAMLAATAFAQTVNYTSFDAVPGKPIEIGNYAAAGLNCTPGAAPTIKVMEPPSAGTLSIRIEERVFVVPNCRPVKMPAQVLTYRARNGAAGSDHFVYDLVGATGQVAVHDVTIRLQEPPKAAPAPKPDIKL